MQFMEHPGESTFTVLSGDHHEENIDPADSGHFKLRIGRL